MFTKSVKLAACRSSREFASRHISKTSSSQNSGAITSRQQIPNATNEQLRQESKWVRLSKHNYNRALSTLQTKITSSPNISLVSKDESREFTAVFPDIVRDLTDASRHTDIPEVTKWYTKVLQYNVPNGKKNRGLILVSAYKMFEDPKNFTPENIRLANILGWCVELFQAFLLVLDDIMDSSESRRGAPCWYKTPGVGLNAISDGILLLEGVYSILRRYLSGHPCHVPVMELFHDITMKTAMGQTLDTIFSTTDGRPYLDAFTMKRYNSIVKYKTAYGSFQLPVTLAMYLAGKYDPEMHSQTKTILLEMGHLFQVQDDFLDCFGEISATGKEGSDIREGKCSWLVVVALQRATSTQRKVLEEHYGRPEEASIQAVRNLYEELGLPNTYSIYQEESYNLIRTHVQQISKGLPHNLFFKFLDKIYKREG